MSTIITMPQVVSPMLAHTAEKPFDSGNHFFEIKWDGIRCLALIRPGGQLVLQSRNFREITPYFPELASLPQSCQAPAAIFDGELVVLNSQSKSDFSLIQKRIRTTTAGRVANYAVRFPATYMVFDLLYLGTAELFHLPLAQRKKLLTTTLEESQRWVITQPIHGLGKAYAELVFAQGFEGIIAKDENSPYLPGKRSEFWLKIKNHKLLTATIIGFTAPAKTNSVASLILALPSHDDSWRYIGRVGTGFDTKTASSLLQILAKNLIPNPPAPVPKTEKQSWWVRPFLRCRVEYLEFTSEGLLRHPVFKGIINDD